MNNANKSIESDLKVGVRYANSIIQSAHFNIMSPQTTLRGMIQRVPRIER